MNADILIDKKICKVNYKNKIDGIKLLNNINSETIKTAFFDPQYRGVLDKMKYGNEGKKGGKASCELKQMDNTCSF